jgi:hypothetical protein
MLSLIEFAALTLLAVGNLAIVRVIAVKSKISSL